MDAGPGIVNAIACHVRFLETKTPESAKVVLDFRKADSPPCAFTPCSKCPLPAPRNRLAARIEAGN